MMPRWTDEARIRDESERLAVAGAGQEPAGSIRWPERLSLLLLALVIGAGLVKGGYLDYEDSPWLKLPGRLAGLAGMAADDIRIHGLTHHEPDALLSAIAVAPGGSLIGFDAVQARKKLEGLDWVAAAKVQRLFPNQLEISVMERAALRRLAARQHVSCDRSALAA